MTLITDCFEDVRLFSIEWGVSELPALWKVSALWTWHSLPVLFLKKHTLIIDITEPGLAWSKYSLLIWNFPESMHTSCVSFKSLLWYSENPHILLTCKTAWCVLEVIVFLMDLIVITWCQVFPWDLHLPCTKIPCYCITYQAGKTAQEISAYKDLSLHAQNHTEVHCATMCL